MGREAVARAEWRGEVAEVKALLEATEIILRGDIRLRLPLAGVRTMVEGDDLVVENADGRLRLGLGSDEAARWKLKIDTPPRTLAEKLGVRADVRVLVTGDWLADEALAAALAGHVGQPASLHVAVLLETAEFEPAVRTALELGLPTWFVHGKGKAAAVTDNMIRVRMRAEGWIDTKTSAVSDRLTTTRYQPRG